MISKTELPQSSIRLSFIVYRWVSHLDIEDQFCDPNTLSIKAEPASPGAVVTSVSSETIADAYLDFTPRTESRKRSNSQSNNNQCNRERQTIKVEVDRTRFI